MGAVICDHSGSGCGRSGVACAVNESSSSDRIATAADAVELAESC